MKLSIITATYNAIDHFPNLVESLRKQTNKDFEWVIADGGSTDGTVELVESIKDLPIKLIVSDDFGIYDALNKAIKESSGDYYLVLGADDVLYEGAVEIYSSYLNDDYDIVTANIHAGNGVLTPTGKRPWLHGQSCYISGHAVGSVYRKSLHEKFGYYSKKYPIAADQFFVLSAIKGGSKVKSIDKLVGEFSTQGLSGTDLLGSYFEFHRVQIALGESKLLQIILLIMNLARNFDKI
jgi:glycosyltransferase